MKPQSAPHRCQHDQRVAQLAAAQMVQRPPRRTPHRIPRSVRRVRGGTCGSPGVCEPNVEQCLVEREELHVWTCSIGCAFANRAGEVRPTGACRAIRVHPSAGPSGTRGVRASRRRVAVALKRIARGSGPAISESITLVIPPIWCGAGPTSSTFGRWTGVGFGRLAAVWGFKSFK